MLAPATFMAHISHSLHAFLQAYRGQQDTTCLHQNMDTALAEMEAAKTTLWTTHHGVFSEWYTHDRLFGIDGKIHAMKQILNIR